MITKTKPAHNVRLMWADQNIWGDHYKSYQTINTGSETITYGVGRMANGHYPWKPCMHIYDNYVVNAYAGSGSRNLEYPWGTVGSSWNDIDVAPPISIADPGWDQSLLSAVMDQIDLNKGESVLLYSGVLQAVPLLGSVATFTRTLNRAARNLSKSFRKKPFATVVKSLIQADFIDRFVISPMIDDAKRFQDACDYVLRTINTAQERNAHPFALSSTSNRVLHSKVSTYVTRTTSTAPLTTFMVKEEGMVTDKAFALIEARYNLDSATPIKLWARRVGLTRPLDSVWDLVPFSFVVDYFTRAGDFISHLSDEMSDVEGLRGKIVSIHGLWGTHYARSERSVKPITWEWSEESPDATDTKVYVPSESLVRSGVFHRFEIPDPFSALLSAQESLSDYLSVNLELSSTRQRTLAELIIQAKL